MRVLLVNAAPAREHWPIGQACSHWVPTGLAYMATALRRAGHEVKVHVREEHLVRNGFDWKAENENFRCVLREFRPELVGVSALSPMVKDAARVCSWAKDICGPEVVTVAGGSHPSALPEETLDVCSDLDVVAVGEGERTIVELAERGAREDVAGLVYRDDGRYVRTPAREACRDLDSLGPPAYELFDMSYYTQPNQWMIRWLRLSATNIRTSRGCPNRCRFCAGHVVSGVGVRLHSLDYVMDQILNAVERFHVEAIHFEDDTIGFNRQRMLNLCERLQKADLHRKIKWDCCLRVDQAEPELLGAMKAAGCRQIEYGFESGYEEGLRSVGKNVTLEMNRRAVRITRQAGLRTFANIMLGLPGETKKQLKETVKFMQWAHADVLSLNRLCPLPGTPIFDGLPEEVKSGIDWGAYSYLSIFGTRFNFTSMPDEQFERIFRKTYRYLAYPQQLWALLRDNPQFNRPQRRWYWRKLIRFAVRHPIRALRVPW